MFNCFCLSYFSYLCYATNCPCDQLSCEQVPAHNCSATNCPATNCPRPTETIKRRIRKISNLVQFHFPHFHFLIGLSFTSDTIQVKSVAVSGSSCVFQLYWTGWLKCSSGFTENWYVYEYQFFVCLFSGKKWHNYRNF